jgi:hypothetical protein
VPTIWRRRSPCWCRCRCWIWGVIYKGWLRCCVLCHVRWLRVDRRGGILCLGRRGRGSGGGRPLMLIVVYPGIHNDLRTLGVLSAAVVGLVYARVRRSTAVPSAIVEAIIITVKRHDMSTCCSSLRRSPLVCYRWEQRMLERWQEVFGVNCLFDLPRPCDSVTLRSDRRKMYKEAGYSKSMGCACGRRCVRSCVYRSHGSTLSKDHRRRGELEFRSSKEEVVGGKEEKMPRRSCKTEIGR